MNRPEPPLRGSRTPRTGSAARILLAATAVLLLAAVGLVAFVVIGGREDGAATDRAPAPGRSGLERIFVGRSGDLGFVLRGPGPEEEGRFLQDAEARVLGLESDRLVARMDAFNDSERPASLGTGGLSLRIGDETASALSPEPAGPVAAALAGGDPSAPLPPHASRRIGWIARAGAFEEASEATVQLGSEGPRVSLRARRVAERDLAAFDRAPGMPSLERLLAELLR